MKENVSGCFFLNTVYRASYIQVLNFRPLFWIKVHKSAQRCTKLSLRASAWPRSHQEP